MYNQDNHTLHEIIEYHKPFEIVLQIEGSELYQLRFTKEQFNTIGSFLLSLIPYFYKYNPCDMVLNVIVII